MKIGQKVAGLAHCVVDEELGADCKASDGSVCLVRTISLRAY